MFSTAPPQRNKVELLDAGSASRGEIEKSLADLRRINSLLGNTGIVVRETMAFLHQHNLREATLLDVGTGSADLPRALIQAARREGMKIKILGLDSKPLHLEMATHTKNIHLVGGDAFHLPLADNSIDVVLTSLFLHHFRPPEIERLLCEFSRVSRTGWIMNDLTRHILPLLFFRASWPVFARSYLTRHDGLASFRRAYTPDEMRDMLAVMDLPIRRYRVKTPFFRVTVIAEN